MPALSAYRVQTRQRLSWFTEETLIGGLLPLLTPLALFAPLTAVAGAFVGRARLQKENQEGKIVPPPTMFNKTMLLGAVFGLAAMTGIGLLAAGAMFSFSALFTGVLAMESTAIGMALAGGAALVSGALYGGINGRHRMESEYHFAKAYGEPMEGAIQKETPSADKTMEMYETLEPSQKRYVAEEIRRKQERAQKETQKENWR